MVFTCTKLVVIVGIKWLKRMDFKEEELPVSGGGQSE